MEYFHEFYNCMITERWKITHPMTKSNWLGLSFFFSPMLWVLFSKPEMRFLSFCEKGGRPLGFFWGDEANWERDEMGEEFMEIACTEDEEGPAVERGGVCWREAGARVEEAEAGMEPLVMIEARARARLCCWDCIEAASRFVLKRFNRRERRKELLDYLTSPFNTKIFKLSNVSLTWYFSLG